MNTRHYRPGLLERAKRAVRDVLHWMKWTAITLLIGAGIGITAYTNRDAIGQWATDTLTETFNGKAQQVTQKAPNIVAKAPPPAQSIPEEKEDTSRFREGMIREEITPAPTPNPEPQIRPDNPQPPRLDTGIKLPAPLDRPVKYFSGKSFEKTGDMKFRAGVEKGLRNDSIPFTLVDRLYGSEGGYKLNAISSTDARSPIQMIGGTQLECMYKIKHLLPPKAAAAAEYIRPRKNGRGYEVVGVSEKYVLDFIWDKDVSRILGQEYIRNVAQTLKETLRAKLRHDIAEIEKNYRGPDKQARLAELNYHLTRPLNFTDIKFGYVLGPGNPKRPADPGGAANLLAAYADPYIRNQHRRASDYVSPNAAAVNPTLFVSRDAFLVGKGEKKQIKKDWSHAYDLAQSYNHVSSYMGLDILPDDVSRPDQRLSGKNTTPPEHHLS